MKRALSLILPLVLVLQLLCIHAFAAGQNLKTVFRSESYWEMSFMNYDTKPAEVGKYYVKLADSSDNFRAYIITAEGDDLQYDKYAWTYDESTGYLRIGLLEDPWNSGTFSFYDGVFHSEGSYHEAILKQTTGAKSGYTSALSRFEKKYGSYNPVKRLTNSENSFRFREISELSALGYNNFRYVAMYHSAGLVMAEPEKEEAQRIRSYIKPLLGTSQPNAINVHQVYFNISMAEENTGYFYFDSSVDVINLVAAKGTAAKIFNQLNGLKRGALLSSGAATGANITATDLFQGKFEWNSQEAVAVIQLGSSVLIFRGPTQDVRTITEYLHLDAGLWY